MKELIKKPLVFVGLMGSGKSTIGKKVANKLGLKFYDSDKIIELREGLSIVDIHDFKGEDYLRKKEEEVIKEVLNYGVILLSTGSGAFMNDDLRGLILDRAISIWLKADLEILYGRVIRRNTRPELVSSNKKETLEKLMEERYPLYQEANITVESEDFDTHYIVDLVLVRLQKYLNSKD